MGQVPLVLTRNCALIHLVFENTYLPVKCIDISLIYNNP